MPSQHRKTIALFFVEGQTEEEFYKILFANVFRGLTKYIHNLNGNTNIHRKVYGYTLDFLYKHPDTDLMVFCCIDRESRFLAPPLDIDEMRLHFQREGKYRNRVLSADQIIATIMLESWFFHDIDGIYRFLRTPKSKQKPNKYHPPEKQTCRELSLLFKRNNKLYMKGQKCAGLIKSLDLDLISRNCSELQVGINLIKSRCNIR